MRRSAARHGLALAFVLALGASAAALGGTEPESVGRVVTLPDHPGPHWFWLSDILLHRRASAS